MVRVDLILSDVRERYTPQSADAPYARLYTDEDPDLVSMFAYYHRRLVELFSFMKEKKLINGHYNAGESRELLDLITEMGSTRAELCRVGVDFALQDEYRFALADCEKFLERSGGSAIPEDYIPIAVERYEPIFSSSNNSIRPKNSERTYRLQLVGEGSYALVHKYFDEEYGIYVAVKRAKRNISKKDLERFRAEYQLLKRLSFPYIVQAYKYDDNNNSYTLEYCDATLDKWITRNNKDLTFGVRKRVALQFLYGVNYLQLKGILHRDISRTNVLVKQYDYLAVIVKLSDFGLHKDPQSGRTATGSSMKGTIVDPTLENFKDFDLPAEIYSIGFILSFVFSGRQNMGECAGPVRDIVDRCTSGRRQERYSSILDIIADVESLEVDDAASSA